MSDKIKVFVCTEGKKCPKRGSGDVCQAFAQAISEQGVDQAVTVKGTKCLKLCKGGPGVVVMPAKVRYGRVTLDEASEIVAQHVKTEAPIERFLYENRKKEKKKDKKGKSSDKEKKKKRE